MNDCTTLLKVIRHEYTKGNEKNAIGYKHMKKKTIIIIKNKSTWRHAVYASSACVRVCLSISLYTP